MKIFQRTICRFQSNTCFRKADAKVEKDFIPTKHFHNKFGEKNVLFLKYRNNNLTIKELFNVLFLKKISTFLFPLRVLFQKREIGHRESQIMCILHRFSCYTKTTAIRIFFNERYYNYIEALLASLQEICGTLLSF